MGLYTYSAASGVTIFGGKTAPTDVPPPTVALVGDSLTALSYGPIHPFSWMTGPLKTIANCGVASDTIQMVTARIDNSYTNAQPGLAGLPEPLGWIFLRIGTNNFRGGTLINSTTQNAYIALFAKLLGYAARVVVFAVPPVEDPPNTAGLGPNSANAWLQSYIAGQPRMYWVDDCADVRTPGGNWSDPAYHATVEDGVHFSNRGSYALGKTGAPLVAAIMAPFAYPSPLVVDGADKYPATANWVQNSVMSGNGGTNGIGAGLVVSGWQISRSGAGNNADTSIVPADGGDPNQTPWQRITPTALGTNTTYITLRSGLLFPAITTSYPEALDVLAQVRFNDLDGSKFQSISHFVYGTSNENLSPPSYLRLEEPEMVNRTVTWRTAVRRSGTRVSHSSAYIDWRIRSAGAFTGAMGSIDVRCLSIRAS